MMANITLLSSFRTKRLRHTPEHSFLKQWVCQETSESVSHWSPLTNRKGLWVERFTFDGKQITNRYIEDSHDEWSIYLVGAERSTRNASAQIDFYERTVKEDTSNGSYSGRIVSFKTR